MNTNRDFSDILGCWIDGALPRNPQEICERLSTLAAHIGADSDQLAYESEDLSEEDRELWLQDVQQEIDDAINDVLNPHGFLAIWDSGDYIVFHQSEYFAQESDYLTVYN